MMVFVAGNSATAGSQQGMPSHDGTGNDDMPTPSSEHAADKFASTIDGLSVRRSTSMGIQKPKSSSAEHKKEQQIEPLHSLQSPAETNPDMSPDKDVSARQLRVCFKLSLVHFIASA